MEKIRKVKQKTPFLPIFFHDERSKPQEPLTPTLCGEDHPC
jgi:hypothetical protein